MPEPPEPPPQCCCMLPLCWDWNCSSMAFSQEVKSAITDSNILPSSSVSLEEIYQVFVIISCLCCHSLQRTPALNVTKSPMNCKKLQALSVQTFRQDKLQLFSPVSEAVLIYIVGRSAPLCGTSLEGEIDCILLVPYLCLESSVKNIFLDYIKINFKFVCDSLVLPCPLPWVWNDGRPSCSTGAVREQVGSCWVLLCIEALLNTYFSV